MSRQMMMRQLLLLAVVVAALAGGRVHAQGTCYEWGSSGTVGGQVVGWFPSPQLVDERLNELCVGYAASCGCTQNSDIHHRSGGSFTTWPTYRWEGTCTRGETVTNISGTYQNRTRAGGCPVCPPFGTNVSVIIQGGSTSVGDDICGNEDGCSYKVTSPMRQILLRGGYGPVVSARSNGYACASQPHTALDRREESGTDCVDSEGTIACLDTAAAGGQGCGWFNGDYICTGHVPDGSCVSFASGAVACVAGAAGAPTDSNGNPAEPVGSVSDGYTTVNYYDQLTVNNSSTTVETTTGQGGSAIGAPGRDGSSSGSGSGGGGGGTIINCPPGETCVEIDLEGECPEGQTCDGSLPGGGTFDEVCTFGECASAFYARIQNAPIVQSVIGVGASFPDGACPNWTLEAFQEDYLLSGPMCDIWEEVSPVLSAMFLLIWGWIATRIVLSA